MKKALLSILLCLATVWGALSQDKVVYTIDLSSLSHDETVAVLALQGLSNRTEPTVYVEPRDKGGFKGGGYKVQDANVQRDGLKAISESTLEKYPYIESVWEDFYATKYGYTFEEVSFDELFENLKEAYTGVVLYGGKNSPEGVAIAVTTAAQTDAIPVTAELLEQHAFFKQEQVVSDLVAMNFADRLAAHRWAIDTYLDKTSQDFAWSYWSPENNYYSIDFAVKNKVFSFNLSFANEEIHTDGDKSYEYDPVEYGMFDEIAAHLHPGSIILGWGEPNEFILQARCGHVGHALLCTNVSPNMSLHQAIPATDIAREQVRQLNADDVQLENKIYITFSINEGDTYKSIGNVMLDGVWLHSQRGQIPFNWPINPKILDMFPAIADYYYSTITENDYFYVPTSGIGYYDATFSTPEQREVYASKSKLCIDKFDMHYMDVWWNNFEGNDSWIKSMGVDGYTKWTSKQCVNFNTAIPSIESELYYDLYNPPTKRKASNMAYYIKRQTESIVASGNRPWFVHVYACDPTFAAEVMKNLDPEHYKAICMDEFFILANKAKSKLLLRKVEKDQELIDSLILSTESERYMEEFDEQTNWISYFCDFNIENGQCYIEGNGQMYYTQLVKNGNKYNLDKYPYFAARVIKTPTDKNVKWLLKVSDGSNTYRLPGEETYLLNDTSSIYYWNIKEITQWSGIKACNLQLVMEGQSNSQMDGENMIFDWIHSYATEDEIGSGESHVTTPQRNGNQYTAQIDRGNGIAYFFGEETIEHLALYDMTGKFITSVQDCNALNIQGMNGVYIVLINHKYALKLYL